MQHDARWALCTIPKTDRCMLVWWAPFYFAMLLHLPGSRSVTFGRLRTGHTTSRYLPTKEAGADTDVLRQGILRTAVSTTSWSQDASVWGSRASFDTCARMTPESRSLRSTRPALGYPSAFSVGGGLCCGSPKTRLSPWYDISSLLPRPSALNDAGTAWTQSH